MENSAIFLFSLFLLIIFLASTLVSIKRANKLNTQKAHIFCPNHPDQPGEVICGICDQLFCNSCMKPFKSLHFCKKHIPLMMTNEWEEILTLKTSNSDPENGVRLYDAKKAIFEMDHLPSYIEIRYKINDENDFIETHLVMFTVGEHVNEFKLKLEKLLT